MWQPLFVAAALFPLHRPFETLVALHPFLDPPPHSSSSSSSFQSLLLASDPVWAIIFLLILTCRCCGGSFTCQFRFARLKQGNPTAAAHPTSHLQLPSVEPISLRFLSIY